mgnify:FL=1
MKQENSKSINEKDYVTLYKCGNYKEIVCCRQDTKPIQITKLTKNQYIDNNTGEIKEYHYTGNKTLNNIRKQFKNIPRLIKGYFDGNNTERFITLTYSYIMSNPYCLSYDFKKFIRKIKRRYGKCRYIYIKEPNRKGSWHIHSLIKRLDKNPFNITDEVLRKLWGNGYAVSVNIPYNINTLPYYFDVSVSKEKQERLKFYPSYLNIYGCSEDMKIEKINGIYKDLKPSEMTKIYDSENQYIMVNQEDGEITGQWKTAYEQYKAE